MLYVTYQCYSPSCCIHFISGGMLLLQTFHLPTPSLLMTMVSKNECTYTHSVTLSKIIVNVFRSFVVDERVDLYLLSVVYAVDNVGNVCRFQTLFLQFNRKSAHLHS